MWNEVFLYIVFTGQVLVGSYFLPTVIYRRALDIIHNHPPLEYPRLYPNQYSDRFIKSALGTYRFFNKMIMFLGFSIIFHAIVSNSEDLLNWDDQGVIFVYQTMQNLPLLVIALLCFSYYKSMRRENTQTQRRALIQRRKLSDYISPVIMGITVTNIAAYLYLLWIINQNPFDGFAGILPNLFGAVFINGICAAVVVQQLYGKKQDPHQASSDRIQTASIAIKLSVFISIVATAYMSINFLLAWFELRAIGNVIQSSYVMFIYLSLIFFLTRMKDINFDVYKADAIKSPKG